MSEQEITTSQNNATIRQTFFFGLATFKPGKNGRPRLRPVWPRLLVTMAILALTLWTAKSIAIYSIYRVGRQFNQITVTDALLFPLNRKEVAHKLGVYQIGLAMEALSKQDYRMGQMYLSFGLARAPDNMEGRIALAGLHRLMKDEDNTIAILKRGLDFHGDNPTYLKTCLQTMMLYRDDAFIMDYASTRLANVTDKPSDAERMIAYVAAQVSESRGRFADTIDYLNRFTLSGTEEGCMLLAKAYWDCEDKETAIATLNNFLSRHPRAPAVGIRSRLNTYMHTMGRNQEALILSLAVVSDNPKSFEARHNLIEAYHNMGNQAKAAAEAARYIMDFSDNAKALLALANYAISTSDIKLSKNIYDMAAEHGYNMGAFGLMMIETHLSAGKYQQAADFCQQIVDENPKWLSYYEGQINFLRGAAASALGQDSIADLYFSRVLDSPLQGNELLPMAKLLHTISQDSNAMRLLKRAYVLDPKNEGIVTLMVEIDLNHQLDAKLIDNIDTLLDLRRPEYTLLRKARVRMTSDRFIFDPHRDEVLAKLDAAIAEPEQIKSL